MPTSLTPTNPMTGGMGQMTEDEQFSEAMNAYKTQSGGVLPTDKKGTSINLTPDEQMLRGDDIWNVQPASLLTKKEGSGLVKKIGTDIGETMTGLTGDVLKRGMTSTSPLTPMGSYNIMGEMAGGANKVINDVVKTVWDKIPDTAKEDFKNYVYNAVEGAVGKENLETALPVLKDYASNFANNLANAYSVLKSIAPDSAKELERTWNQAQFAGTAEGAKGLTEVAGKGITKVAGQALEKIAAGGEAKLAEKALDKTIEATRPILSKAERIAAREAGKETPATLFQPAKIAETAKDVERAKTLEGIYDPKANTTTNIKNITNERTKIAKETIAGLEKNDAIFNKKQLTAKLDAVEKPVLLTSDASMSRAYDLAQQKFMQFVEKQPKKLSGLLKARQEFDAWVAKQFPNLYTDEKVTALRQALKDMRNATNDYIETKLPANSPFREQLRKQHLMFEATENLAERGESLAGKGLLQQKVEEYGAEHPLQKAFVKTMLPTAGGLGGAYAGYKAITGK